MRLASLLLTLAALPLTAAPALLDQYCAGCHNPKLKSGGLDLRRLNPARPESHAAEWERVVVKLRAGLMPPAGAPRPDAATIRQFLKQVEDRLDEAAARNPNPGRPSLHRLNRAEYANSVRDLLGIEIDPAAHLPPDDMSHGFDNMSEVLTVSPALIDGYVRAAGKLSRLALGDPKMSPLVETYHVPSTVSQTGHIDGAPLGTRGGIVFKHIFPADAEYIFRITLYFTTNTFLFGTHQKGEQLEIAVNGERVALLNVNPAMKVDEDLRTPPIRIPAGSQTISAAFIQRAAGPVDDFVQPFEHSLGDLFLGRTLGLTGLPHVRDVGINGPHNATGAGDTAVRRRILVCGPATAADELPCARRIVSAVARQAYRRPVTDHDIEALLSTYQKGRNADGFEGGIRLALQSILANPEFVFRFERTPASIATGKNYRISDLELASRLSYFLWSSAPDQKLIALAAEGRLGRPKVLEEEVRRMLADSRSEALSANFAGQWLHLRNLQDALPDLFEFPNANRNLLQSMRRETELLYDSIVRGDRSVASLLTADHTFVDERLAKHYGIPDIKGNRFRRVNVVDENRRGLLGHASLLTVTSFATRTSPVVRGKWVLDNILGAPPPSPPADVPPLKENQDGAKHRPVRERLEEHRANPACAGCHTQMDPIGFALESFDAIGQWRIRDSGFDINAAGQLVDGTPLDGPASLRIALVARQDAFVRTFITKLLTYALGRGTEYFDMPAVRAIERSATAVDNRFSTIVLGIVNSVPFQMRRAEGQD